MKQLTFSNVFTLATLLALAGCANTGADVRPIVDTQGINQAQYERDLADCQNLAQQQSGAGESAAKTAVGGAAVGGLIGLVTGGNGTRIAQSAGVGAVIGGATGAYSGNKAQEGIVKRCLTGRGYRVLN
jgi:outer membrane lipoprotein SlyB